MAGEDTDGQQTGRFTPEGSKDDESDNPSDLSQVEQAHHTRHRSFSDEESLPAEDEALYHEDEGEDEDIVSGSEVEDQYDEDPDASSDEEPEAADLPRQSSTQHEVIVLDSDSEDELTSEQPANPHFMHQEANTYRDSSTQSENEGLDLAEDEESQSEAEYSEDDENEQAEEFGQNDRVHDSNMEDESSVDVLAQDYSSQKHSTQESSMHERDHKGDVSDAGSEVVSPKDYHSDNVIKTGANTETVIGLDSDEDKSSEVGEIAPSREDSASASQIEKAWSGAEPKPTGLHGWDGTYDERSDERAPLGDIQIGNEAAETTSAQSTWPQLLTPDPTQEVNDSQATVNKERTVEPSPSAPEFAPSTSDHPSENVVATSLPEQVFSSEDVPDEKLAGDPLVVIPTTETIQLEEQSKATQGETREAPAVVVSQFPAPDRHAHGLRSKLSYFAPLATLIDHFSALVDTISIVHEVSPIAKATSGPKDYFMTIQLTDPSMAGTVLQAQIFRRYKTAMPVLVEGNAVLLRNFKVCSFDHSITLVSVESSSWAVFDGSGPKAQVNGPPVEYRSEELAYASGLRKWYADFGASMVADHQLQASILSESVEREGSAMISESGSVDSVSCGDPPSSARSSRRSRKSHRQVTIHELRDGRRYTEVGSPSSKESIHELRDGTLYANL
ncbi:Telomere end binding protein [Penicillium odoratum]|uniref:Telomere end binding protein n=1 Tax=Penicillium odoratum TaxID=1167516 RepID=UPI0025485CFE|nr:Telomere end binding protein [Penicillium odoratum]KAJ5759770.1 Telomere end binding protein [Penicillium odoratum]